MKSNLLKTLMFILLAGFMPACGDDDDPKEPLKAAFIELNENSDATLRFKGDAGEQTIAIIANREIVATASADWVTTTQTAGKDTVYLKVAVAKSGEKKKRTATISLATKEAEDGDKSVSLSQPLEIEQSVPGLPDADLLDIVFTNPGNGPGLARDISPLENTVRDMTTSMKDDGITENCPKVYPTIAPNTDYGRNIATFTGAQGSGENGVAGCHNDRGSCAYRIDLVDYTQWKAHYTPHDPPSYGDPMPGNTQIPFTSLGDGVLNGSVSLEVIFRAKAPANDRNQGTIVGWFVSYGAKLDLSKEGKLNWFLDSGPEAVSDTSDPLNFPYKKAGETGEFTPLENGKFYHAVVTYDRTAGKMAIFMDGVKSAGEMNLQPGYVMRTALPYKSDALGQYIVIGGCPFRTDPPVGPAEHINDTWNNWAQWLYTGDIALVRMYGKVLTAEEVKILYDYEKPE